MFTNNERRLMFTHNKQAWANSILVGCMEKLSGCGPYVLPYRSKVNPNLRGLAYQACWGSEPWAQDEAEYFFQPCNCASHEHVQMQASVLHRLWFSTSHADKSPCPVHSLRLTSPLMIIMSSNLHYRKHCNVTAHSVLMLFNLELLSPLNVII